jgi:DNA-3-methyladenine glycosylase
MRREKPSFLRSPEQKLLRSSGSVIQRLVRTSLSCLPISFFARPVWEVAQALIGVRLFVDGVGGPIVETEAYNREDPASHSFAGRTARNAAMFGPPGCAYVYRSYGLHWCLNLVCGPEPGAAVLIRALEPEREIALMAERRGSAVVRDLCRGPGRLCQALGISGAFDGRRLDLPPFDLLDRSDTPPITSGPRIGITRGADTPWRFMVAGSRYVSRGGGSQNASG